MGWSAPIPAQENARLEALRALDVPDAQSDAVLDDIAGLTARLLAAPIAFISVTGADRQVVLAARGSTRTEAPREVTFCAHVIASGVPLIVPDARRDPRFMHNPFVVGAPNLRFYAGAPLLSEGGFCIGTLCVLDMAERAFTPAEHDDLMRLSRMVSAQLQARSRQAAIEGAIAARDKAEAHLHHIVAESSAAFSACDRLAANLGGRFRNALARVESRIVQQEPGGAELEFAALRDLAEDLASIARLEGGVLRTEAHLFEPAAIVRDVVNDLAITAARRGVEMHVRDGGAGFSMLGEPTRFDELVEELLGDLLPQSDQGVLAVTCGFDTLPTARSSFVMKFEMARGWNADLETWRLGQRSRDLIEAMGGAWCLAREQRLLSVALPARLRSPSLSRTTAPANVVWFEELRRERTNELGY